MLTYRHILLALALGVITVSASAKIYTWTDENGKRHYSDTPPPKASNVEEKTVDTSTTSFAVRTKPEAKPNDEQGLEEGSTLESTPAKDPAKCEKARKQLQFISDAPRLRTTDENGEYYYLTPEQIGKEKSKVQQAINIYCK